jgi:hypothetical protein
VAGSDEELLAAFERLSPQGSLRVGFDDALRRVDQPDVDSAAMAPPWSGLPDDLWERGRSARIGQRFVGDVAGVLADILAADARTAADAAVTAVNGDRFVATWDALRFWRPGSSCSSPGPTPSVSKRPSGRGRCLIRASGSEVARVAGSGGRQPAAGDRG